MPARRFPLSFFADEVHAVVPVTAAHERQTVLAKFQTIFYGAHAMFVKRAGFGRALRQIVIRFFLRFEGAASRKGADSSSTPVSPVVST